MADKEVDSDGPSSYLDVLSRLVFIHWKRIVVCFLAILVMLTVSQFLLVFQDVWTADEQFAIPPLSESEQHTWIDFSIERSFKFRHQNNYSSHIDRRIPKYLHFIWTDMFIPKIFVENLRSFRSNNPDWTIYLWTFKNSRDIIAHKEPKLLQLFDKFGLKAMKADVVRFVVMFHCGGAYFDIDTKSVKPLDPFVKGRECIVSAESRENAIVYLKRRSLLASSVFLCRPKHPLFKYFIDRLPLYGNEKSIMAAAGPLFVTWSVQKFIHIHINHPMEPQGPLIRDDAYEGTPGFPRMNTNMVSYNQAIGDVNFEVVSSRYFEDHILAETSVQFAKLCAETRQRRSRPIAGIVDINSEDVKRTELHRHYGVEWISIVLSACSYWRKHGGILRTLSPDAITVHLHYGTYLKEHREEIKTSPKHSIYDIIPDAIVPTLDTFTDSVDL